MKKYLLSVILTLAVFCLPSLAQAGTCNASYTNTLPQLSGGGGAVPPSLPGQTAPGFITSVTASGTNLNFVYTPTVGAAQPFTVSLGASSGISCTGSWSGARLYDWLETNNFGTMNSSVRINGVANTITCTGMQTYYGGTFGSPTFAGGLGMVTTGPGSNQITLSGYSAAGGAGYNIIAEMNVQGSCHLNYGGDALDGSNVLHLTASLSGGATSVQFLVDGVSKGTDSVAPYDLVVSPNVSIGRHTLKIIATFPLGTEAVEYINGIMYSPTKVTSGDSVTCAIVDNGDAMCWGDNTYGSLGANSGSTTSAVPVHVTGSTVSPSPGPDLRWISDISAGNSSVCAANNGGVACWGRNLNGILGVSGATLPYSLYPIQVIAQNSGVTNVSVGANHACALYSNGDAKCWGNGTYGQLGNGSVSATVTTPYLTMTGVSKVQVARDASYFLVGTTVYSTGRDNYGQLGNGSTIANITLPASILTGASDLWGFKYHACAKLSSSIKCWGSNGFAELLDGTITAYSPVPITATYLAGVNVASMAGGDETSCAITTAGLVYCVGYNAHAELGFGSTSGGQTTLRTPSGYSTGVLSMTGGYVNTCAFVGGHIKCAGDNTYDQIGDPAASNPQMTPYTASGL